MKLKVDFFRNPEQGQMRPTEREAMYNMLIRKKPDILLEIGTWKGGGSTYIISAAAYEYGGCLHSIEINKEFHDYAKNLFRNRMNILEPHVVFHLGDASEVIPRISPLLDPLGFVLFDGKEDAEQTMKEYNLVKDLLGPRAIIACHDWKISKMSLLRPILEGAKEWKQTVEMLDTDTGFAMFEKE